MQKEKLSFMNLLVLRYLAEFLKVSPIFNKPKDKGSTHPLMLLATDEWRDMDFGDISNSESDLGNKLFLK